MECSSLFAKTEPGCFGEVPEGFTGATELFDQKEYTVSDGKLQVEMEPFTIYMFRVR